MPHFETNYAYCDDDVDALPLYHHYQSQVVELPEGSPSPQELPAPFSITPEILNGPQELQAQIPDDFDIPNFQMDTTRNRDGSVQSAGFNQWSQFNMRCQFQQAPAPLVTPNYLSNLATEQQSYTLPSMTSEGQSDGSSPISLYTPGRDAIDGAQHQCHTDFTNNMVSPHDLVSHATGPCSVDGHNFQGMQGYSPYSPQAHFVEVSPVKMSASPLSTTGLYPHQPTSWATSSASALDILTIHQQQNRELPMSQQSTPNPGVQYPGVEDSRLGTWEFNGSGWHRLPMLADSAGDTYNNMNSHVAGHDVVNGYQEMNNDVNENQHEPSREDSLTDKKQDSARPTLYCAFCPTGFNGTYQKGNLKRHVRQRHSKIRSMAGKMCRICKKVFNRSDATIKHERETHRLCDAKSIRRRRTER